MGKRRENRAFVSIPVSVTGTDHYGNPFTQTAQTIDVSRTGARLSGIRCLRGAGELITIECSGRSARFRVVWIGIPGSPEDGHFGVKALQPDNRIFKVDPGPPQADRYMPLEKKASETSPIPPSLRKTETWDGGERRTTYRIRCSGTGQLTQPGVAYPIWARLTDLSLGGCYLELIFTIPNSSVIDLSLTVQGRTFSAKGTVVTSHPGVGIGIKFTSLTDESRRVLVDLLHDLTAQKRPLPLPFDAL